MVKILGIVSHEGSSLEDNRLAEAALKRCFVRLEAWRRQKSEFQIENDIAHLYRIKDVPLLLPQLASANAILLSVHSHALGHLAELGIALHRLESECFSVQGKWIGIIANGERNEYFVVNKAYQVLASCNFAGMLLPPKALAHVRNLRDRDHLRLTIDLAEQLSLYYGWEGRVSSAQAA